MPISRQAFKTEFSGAFSDIIFATTDWSPKRGFLGPFSNVRRRIIDRNRATAGRPYVNKFQAG